MKYSVRFLDNFAMLKDLIEIRSKILDVFYPTEEPDKFLLITTLIDERLHKHLDVLTKEVEEVENV